MRNFHQLCLNDNYRYVEIFFSSHFYFLIRYFVAQFHKNAQFSLLHLHIPNLSVLEKFKVQLNRRIQNYCIKLKKKRNLKFLMNLVFIPPYRVVQKNSKSTNKRSGSVPKLSRIFDFQKLFFSSENHVY